MKTIILFLLFVFLHIVNLQANAVVEQKDSTVMPDLKNDAFVMLTTDSVVRCNFYNSMEGTSVLQGVYREELYISNDVIRGTYYLFPQTRKAKYCPLAFSFDLNNLKILMDTKE